MDGFLSGSTADRFRDRREAGRLLGERLRDFEARDDVVVLGLPRGGVPVAYEVARAIGAPLDVFVVRKLGVPGHEELAMGAIATGGVRIIVEDVVRALGVTEDRLAQVAATEQREIERREREYRGDRPSLDVEGKTVMLVDDGLATGATMRAAVKALRSLSPGEVVVAVPVAAAETCAEFEGDADEVVCLRTPAPFRAVGLWYEEFEQTTDEEVRHLLAHAPSPE